jgi:hypothetical protein
MGSSGRCILQLCVSAALFAAPVLWAARAHAQGDAPKPNTAQQNSGTQQAPSTKSLSNTAPKAILVDPCKAKNPPSYCGKR